MDEISCSVRLAVKKGELKIAKGGTTIKQTLTGTRGGNPGCVAVTNTAAAISFGNLTTLGRVYLKNLSDTNTVYVGKWVGGTLHDCIQIDPGTEHLTQFRSTHLTAIGAVTDAGTADLEVICLEK